MHRYSLELVSNTPHMYSLYQVSIRISCFTGTHCIWCQSQKKYFGIERHTCRLRFPDTPNPKSDTDRFVCVQLIDRPTLGSRNHCRRKKYHSNGKHSQRSGHARKQPFRRRRFAVQSLGCSLWTAALGRKRRSSPTTARSSRSARSCTWMAARQTPWSTTTSAPWRT